MEAMTQDEDPYAILIEAANLCCEKALSGDRGASLTVLEQSVIAIRGLLQFEESDPNKLRLDTRDLNDKRRLIFHEAPSPHRLVYLRALAAMLERVLDGMPLEDAMSLKKPPHREANPSLAIRDVAMFVAVGQELNRLIARGHTRQDKPVDASIRAVAKRFNVSRESVRSAWSLYGAEEGWEARKSEWD